MREAPSDDLLHLLNRLGLASRQRVLSVHRHARKMARDVPLFDSVWVDALMTRRVLTPFQAAEINAGRGQRLKLGGYVLLRPRSEHGYVQIYEARAIETRTRVDVALVERLPEVPGRYKSSLDQLCLAVAQLGDAGLVAYQGHGIDDDRLWIATTPCDALAADSWILCHGRLDPQAVLEIARQMVASLAALESTGQVHGDLSTSNLLLGSTGNVLLQLAGLRPIFRPEEGYAHCSLPIDIYNYLAPERIADGTAPTPASDLYAAGCVWWHLLAGRPPLTGGDGLAKIKAAQEGRVADIRHYAPETPAPLAAAISACCQHDTKRRPESFAALAATLGPSTSQGRLAVSQCVARHQAQGPRIGSAVDRVRQSRYSPVGIAAAAGCLLMAATVSWPMWGDHLTTPLAQLIGERPATDAVPQSDGTTEQTATSVESKSLDSPDGHAPDNAPEQPAALPAAIDALAIGDAPRGGELDQQGPPPQSDLLLPASTMLDASGLPLRAGQTVRPQAGTRAEVIVPRQGLSIDVDNVRFENIDFVMASDPAGATTADTARILTVKAANLHLVRCTFRPADETDRRCVAVAWQESELRQTFRPEETLRLAHCVFRGVAVGVAQERPGPARVEIDNSLHLGPGPLWRVATRDEDHGSSSLVLRRSTLRNAAALADVVAQSTQETSHKVLLETSDSVLAPQYGAALVRVIGAADEVAAAATVEWVGQGSLVTSAATPAVWYDSTGEPRPIEDERLLIEGLVSGQFEFADSSDAGWQASEIRRWTAPLRSPDAPGIRAAALPSSPRSGVVQASYEQRR